MNSPLILLFAALFGVLAGALVTWLALRSRVTAAANLARSEGVSELATTRERLRFQDEEQARLKARNDTLLGEVERWRLAVDEAGNELAKLSERASRVPLLDAKVRELEHALAEATSQAADVREASGRLQAELLAERAGHASLRAQHQSERAGREAAEAAVGRLTTELAQLSTQQAADREQFGEKLSFMDDAKRALTDQFKSLANDILEEKGKRFAEQNQASLGTLLDPLKTKLSEFQAKVDTVYVNDSKDRSALAEQVKQLMGLNQSLSQDAKNLTTALKGSNKTQGNWGELVLERVLEASGLRKDHEYRTQVNHTLEDGGRQQPDVIISLPEERSLVVDSKMSLTAYEEYANAEDDSGRAASLKRHMQSVRNHINSLNSKNYQTLYSLKSLDFVLMFVPVEPAFMLAIGNDGNLFKDAWDRNVLLVSPSTLLFVVRTVAHLWRQEAQSRNAQEIARRGAELYDRLSAFTLDLEKVGERLRQAQDSFTDARDKLSKNKGNVIRQAEMLKQLGVKPTKALPQTLVEACGVENDEIALNAIEVLAAS